MKEPILIKTKKLEDERGCFYESFNENYFESEYGISKKFVQDNHSVSKYGVIRGLHYQWDKPMDKLVRVSKGKIIDIIIDIRKESKTFGKIYKFIIDESNNNQIWVPAGFAHGFLSLSDETHVQYKCTEFYNKLGESGINPLSLEFKNIFLDYIKHEDIIMSEKDLNSKSFSDYIKNPIF